MFAHYTKMPKVVKNNITKPNDSVKEPVKIVGPPTSL